MVNTKKIKNILLFSLFVNVLPLFFLNSCTSTSLPIPGQSQIITQNIYIEYMKLGDSYMSLEKYSNAIDCYKKAWEDKKLYWTCYYKIAKCYVNTSDWGKALTMFEELLQQDNSNLTLKASMAYVYSKSGNFDKALEIYNDLLTQLPNDEKYLENYINVVLTSKELFEKNQNNFESNFEKLKKDYPENKNISIFQEKINSYTNKPETKEEDKK